jgi:hypothetical protein
MITPMTKIQKSMAQRSVAPPVTTASLQFLVVKDRRCHSNAVVDRLDGMTTPSLLALALRICIETKHDLPLICIYYPWRSYIYTFPRRKNEAF